MNLHLTDMEAMWFGTMAMEWRNKETIDITKMMKDVKTVVDIGACAGFSVNHWLKSFDLDKIVAFEPEKRNFEIMTAMVKPSEKVDLRNIGIYYGFDACTVSHCGDGNPGGRFMTEFAPDCDKDTELLEGSIYNLAKLEDEIDFVPDLIKIDIEGAEYNVIENSTLVKQAKYLYIEWHTKSNLEIERFIFDNLSNYKELARDSRNSILLERT